MITSFSSNQDLEKIFKIQKKTFALSQTPHIMPIAHTAPLFAKHKILPLNKIILKANALHSLQLCSTLSKTHGPKKVKNCKISITPYKKPGITYHAQTGKALNAGLGIHSFQKNTMLLCSFTFFIKERSVLCILLLSL